MAADDTTLGAEEVQIIRALTVGGFGDFPVRAYHQVVALILSRVPISLKDIRPSGASRRNLIVAAMKTGLRLNELLTLTWADLAAKPGKIRVRAENAKANRDRDRLSQIFHTDGVSHDPRRARPTTNPLISWK